MDLYVLYHHEFAVETGDPCRLCGEIGHEPGFTEILGVYSTLDRAKGAASAHESRPETLIWRADESIEPTWFAQALAILECGRAPQFEIALFSLDGGRIYEWREAFDRANLEAKARPIDTAYRTG